MGTLKLKTNNMNNDTHNGATNQPVSLKNESTPDETVFSDSVPAPTAGAATGAGSRTASGEGLY